MVAAGLVAAVTALCAGAIAVGGLDSASAHRGRQVADLPLAILASTWHMIRDYPWSGCGPGNFQGSYTRYKLPEASEVVADPHNFLMEIWSTAGTPAMLAFLAILGCVAWNCCGPGDRTTRRRFNWPK